MRRHAVVIGLSLLGLAAFALFAGWAFYEGTHLHGRWSGLASVWPFLVGMLMTAGLAAFLLWLAAYSARHDWDEPTDER